ncbi:MAG: biotin transporter BioY [Deltaproteobacteria bacterium]|nr:biotin transporter BioY [Deltaproteobacteria bacterium]
MTLRQIAVTGTRRIVVSRHAGALFFALAIGLGASLRVYLPFTPVPITCQSLFILFGASLLKRYYSLEMIGLYLLFGGLGLPFFAAGIGGWSYLLGPTGGYLVGFVLMTAVLGFGLDHCPKRWQQLLLFVVAAKIVFIPGLLWLKLFLHADWSKTLALGFYPFILGDFLKIALAFSAYTVVSRKKN